MLVAYVACVFVLLCLSLSYTFSMIHFFFFFNDTATTEIYTLSLHDALPIYHRREDLPADSRAQRTSNALGHRDLSQGLRQPGDRKSTRLNSSHGYISYAVFCLKKKNTQQQHHADDHSHPTASNPVPRSQCRQ